MNILHINDFIKDNQLKRITNASTFDGIDPARNGLYDPEIFTDESNTFAYIQLPVRVLDPLIYKNIALIDGIFKRILDKPELKFIINEQGVIEESTASGSQGLGFLYENWHKINFKHYVANKNKVLLKTITGLDRNILFSNKILVYPIQLRPFEQVGTLAKSDELTAIYESIIRMSDTLNKSEIAGYLSSTQGSLGFYQQKYNEIAELMISGRYKGKHGLFNSALIGTRVDSVATNVANASPQMPITQAALPWHYCLVILDTMIMGYLLRQSNTDLVRDLGLSTIRTDAKKLSEHFNYIQRNVESYINSEGGIKKKGLWLGLLDNIINELDVHVMVKRNPLFDVYGIAAFRLAVSKTEDASIMVNAYVYTPMGGDSFMADSIYVKTNANHLQVGNNTIATFRSPIITTKALKDIHAGYNRHEQTETNISNSIGNRV
jgi:hypothetical protein